MLPFRTHYANLKVSRDAPPEVVKAAYKALSSRWHPDRCPNDLRAARAMPIINESYAVLSDPKKRAEHDRWIRHQELRQKQDQVRPADLGGSRFERYAQAARPTVAEAQRVAAGAYRAVAELRIDGGPSRAGSRPPAAGPLAAAGPLIPNAGRTLLILGLLLTGVWLLS